MGFHFPLSPKGNNARHYFWWKLINLSHHVPLEFFWSHASLAIDSDSLQSSHTAVQWTCVLSRSLRVFLSLIVHVQHTLPRPRIASEPHSLLPFCKQCLFGALWDEVSQDVGCHRKRHCDNFRLNGPVKLPVVFHRVDPDLSIKCNGENPHALQHGTPKTRQLTDDDTVPFFDMADYRSDFPPLPTDFATRFFFDPFNIPQLLLIGKVKNVRIFFRGLGLRLKLSKTELTPIP